MRVGIDVSQAVFQTGVSDYTVNLVHSLLKSHAQDVVLFGSSLRRKSALKTLFPQVKAFSLPPTALHLLWNKLHVLPVENFIGRVNVFHSSDWTQPPARADKVTTVHDLTPFLYSQSMSSGGLNDIASVHRARMRWVIRECRKIICVSQNTASDMVKLFPETEKRLVVIPEALPQRFETYPSADDVTRLKEKYKLTDYLITIGTPQPRKNISALAQSFLKYKDKLSLPEKLVVVGGRGWVESELPQDGSIVYTGFLPDESLIALLSASSCLVAPSLYEGFGLPLLLAFYHQVPVACSKTSSFPEVAGSAASLFDPYDQLSMAQAISQSLKDSKKLISAGTLRLKNFSWDRTADLTWEVYRNL